jgi:hypothetical protein
MPHSQMNTPSISKTGSTQHNRILNKIQSMSEKDFTENVLVPLLEEMNYKVEYYGGAYEGGKDLICWKNDTFGDKELTLVQVKKVKPSAAASSKRSFGEIVTQLQQAKEKKVPYSDGISRRPVFVFFITPYAIDTRALESRFEAVAGLRVDGIRIFDGTRITEQIISRLPNLALNLSGTDFIVQKSLQSNLSNEDLLSALNYTKDRDISEFYCDLDFGVGKVTTKFFFSLNFAPTKVIHTISPAKWPSFENIAQRTEKLFRVDFVAPTLAKIKKTYQEKFEAWQSESNQRVIIDISKLSIKIAGNISSFLEQCDELVKHTGASKSAWDFASLRENQSIEKSISPALAANYSLVEPLTKNLSAIFRKLHGGAYKSESAIKEISISVKQLKEKLSEISAEAADVTLINSLLENLTHTNSLINRLQNLRKKSIEEPFYEVTIYGDRLADALIFEQKWLREETKKLEAKKRNKELIYAFFARCNELFEGLDGLLADTTFVEAMGASSTQKYIIDDASTRISMPVQEVFNTGINCAVFGDAGAGKSTTLRMYAEQISQADGDQRLTLFLPLTRVVNGTKIYGAGDEPTPLAQFETSLADFLNASGYKISTEDLVEFLKEKSKVVFIFDGVDEVIKSSPWIIDAIKSIGNAYSNSQTILSSRASGTYINEITCLSLTLLPFSDDQLFGFVRGWFKNDINIAQLVERHLKNTPAVAEIARSPLLATILCVLAENKVPLPDSELSMYSERMKLLLGHYDIHKKTKRVSSHHSLLETVSRKLAFFLHNSNLRSAPLVSLQDAAFDALSNKYVKEDIFLAVKELHDPCNMLVPMTEDGQFGFGHLRYQEYLAATELCGNRGIELIPRLNSVWWRPVLVLFARMTDDVEHVISNVIENLDKLGQTEETLMAMISVRPANERAQLSYILTANSRLDSLNDELQDFHEYDVGSTDW